MAYLASTVDPTEDPSDDLTLEEGVEQAVTVTVDIVSIIGSALIGAAIGLVITVVIIIVAQLFARRRPIVSPALEPPKRPLQLTLMLTGAWIGFSLSSARAADEPEPSWRHPIFHLGLILIILAGTWFVASLVVGFEAAVIRHVEKSATKRAKRIQTQFQIVRRVLVALVWTFGIGGVLITFPSARAAGASIFASAGLISVIAGLAAQSTLGNVFAGLQVAFSDSLRVDDVVIINSEYSVVEEITLTYVVVRVWDGRRIIVPSSKLTTETFENWTRRDTEMLGKIYFDLDWRVPLDAMRSEMHRCLNESDLWDGRTAVLQVDSAENGRVRVAILVSAVDSATLTDLRNYTREHMVKWIQQKVPRALPYARNLYASIEDLEAAVAEYPDPKEFVDAEPEVEKPRRPQTDIDLEETVILPTDYLPFRRSLSTRGPVELSEEELSSTPNTATDVKPGHEASLFTGSAQAEERKKGFSGPGEEAIAERERRAAQRNLVDDDESTDTESEETR